MNQDDHRRAGHDRNFASRRGREASTRARADSSSWYARSEAGRSNDAGVPSSYTRTDNVEYPRRREADEPHISRRHRGAESSQSHATNTNGRDFHAPPSVREGAVRRISVNHPLHRPASHGPPLTRQSVPHSRTKPPTRPIRSAIQSKRNSHPSQRGLLTKKVRFETASGEPGSRLSSTSVSVQSRPPPQPSREQEEVSDVRRKASYRVDVRKPLRSGSKLVAIICRAVRRLLARKRISRITLHPLLHVSTLAHPTLLLWDVRRSPLLSQSTLTGVAGLTDPATSPPLPSMRLLVNIPGLIDAQWSMTVFPIDSPSPRSQPRGNPGTTATIPVIRCIDVLHALHALLQRRVKEHEYSALEKRRKERVSRVFWERCSPEGGHRSGASARNERHQNPSPEARFGARRIDLLDGWGGLSEAGQGEWIVRFRDAGGA